jgi:tripartite-type tricarboxylate transporter receptor subunit TctC
MTTLVADSVALRTAATPLHTAANAELMARPQPILARRTFLKASLAGFIALAAVHSVAAQPAKYPAYPIKIIVPFAAGGGVDAFARLLAKQIEEKRGKTVVIENRAGANGTVGASGVLQSQPDGHTLLFSAATHVMARQVMSKVPFDPVTDFTPIARVGEAPMLVVMSPQRPQKTIAEVIEDARKNPNQWEFGVSAIGSPGHIATIAFSQLAQTKFTIVPYRGTAPALTDVSGGHIQLMIDPVIALLPMAREGQVKALATTTAKRSQLTPDIPTAAESGMPGLEFASWYGLWGPKNMPAETVSWLSTAMADATRELAAAGRLAALGIEPIYESPEEFSRFIAREVARNAELLKAADFKPL